MKKKLLTVLLATTASLCLCFSLAACDFGGNPNDGHTHEYSQTWSYDNTQHWRECIGCDAKKDTAKHSFKNDICDICGCIKGASELSVAGKSFVFDSVEITCDSEEMAEYAEQLKAQAEEQMKNDYITFGAGGICSVVSNGKIANGTYTQNGNTVSMTLGGETGEIAVTENSVSVVTAMPNLTLTVLYVKGTPQKPVIPDTPDKPENPNVCKHENLCFVEDHKDADCREEGYDLNVAVCKNILNGNICGTVLNWSESGNKELGKLNIYSEYEFGNWIESGEIKNYLSEYRTVISKTDHTPVIDGAVPATCSTKGLTEGSHCGVCNTVLKAQTETDFADHSYTDTLVRVNDTNNVCSACGKLDNSDIRFIAELNEDGNSYGIKKISPVSKTVNLSSYLTYNGKPITAILDNAFSYYKLEGVTIGKNITSIGRRAFFDCDNLTSVTIPNSVTSIGYQAFACPAITIYCEATSQPHGWVEGWNVSPFFEVRWCPVVWNCNDNDKTNDGYIYAIIDGIRYSLKDGQATVVKQQYNTTSANIPTNVSYKNVSYSVTSIGNYAFSGCTGLTSITIPELVTSISGSLFSGCTGLTSITISSGNTKYHSAGNCIIETANKTLIVGCKSSIIPTDGSVTSIGSYAFSGCSSITSIAIPNGVTSIGDNAFNGCSSLTSIAIPNGVTSFGSYAFSGCESLTNITIPDSVTSIGGSAFLICSSLTSITFKGTKAQWYAIEKNYGWNYDTGNYTIYCTDGDIAKS